MSLSDSSPFGVPLQRQLWVSEPSFCSVLCGVTTWGVRYQAQVKDAVPPSGVNPLLAAGVFLLFMSFLGFVGALFDTKRWGRCILLIYSMTMLVTIILEIVAGSVLLQAMGKINSSALGTLTDDSVYRLINGTYTDCCVDHPPVNDVTPCWTFRHSSIVVYPESCANGNVFRDDFARWMVSKLTPMAATCLSFLALELLVVVGSCCAICGRRQADKRKATRRGKALEEEEDDLDLETDTDPLPPKSGSMSRGRRPAPAAYHDDEDVDVDLESPPAKRVSSSRRKAPVPAYTDDDDDAL